MTKTTKPNYNATLTYGKTKYANKDMYMTDNENNKVLENAISNLSDDEETKELKRV
ncbi:MAG: hypothetical protein HRT72_12490, partial [Flavobacteriales bacterium]|nr:hypothetical protein [Flavobacteriales bacterium]